MAEQGGERTLTALYETEAAADRAADRLVEAGLPRSSIEAERASEADVSASKHHRSKLMAALWELEMPSADRQSYERGLDRGGVVLVAHGVPEALRGTAFDIMAADALDAGADSGEDEASPDHAGAIGTAGGYGRASGDVDRLTGRRMGPADPPDAGPRKPRGAAGSGRVRSYPAGG
jgi:hypothetical protein